MENADLLKASSGSGPAVIAKVQRPRNRGGKIIDVDSTANWPDKFIATYGRLDSNGSILPNSIVEFVGRKSGSDIEILNFEPGFSDAGNQIGDIVVVKPTTGFANRVANYFLESSNKFKKLVEYSFIASPNDLNDAQFLVPGRWRFGSDQEISSTKNLPLANSTGVMETISHSGGATRPGTHAWSYVLQIFTTLSGRMFIRHISSGASAGDISYGAWQEFMQKNIEKHTKDSHGWIKRELPDGVTEYSNTGRVHNVYTQPHVRVTDKYIILPSGISNFNSDTMAISAAVRAHNPNLIASISIAPNDHRISISRANLHNGDITSHIDYNIILRVYPK